MPNWKEGIDVTVPGGLTPLPNYRFVAPWGSDSTGDGTPATPWASLSYAVSQSSGSAKIVLYTGVYSESGISLNSQTIIGDGYVSLEAITTGQTLFNVTTRYPYFILENLTIRDYEYGVNHTVDTDNINHPYHFKNCVLINTKIYSNDNGSNNLSQFNLQDCIAINSTIDVRHRSYLGMTSAAAIHRRCIFINSIVQTNHGIWGCYFDADCDLQLEFSSDGSNQVHTQWTNYNDIECPITYLGTVYANLQAQLAAVPNVNANSINMPPLFNNLAGGDFSLQMASPLIATGPAGENIGGTLQADAFFRGSQLIDALVAEGDPDLVYNAQDDIELVGSPVQVTSPLQVNSQLRYLPKIDFAGFPDISLDTIISNVGDDILTYEIAWSLSDVGALGAYKKFRLGEIPTLDNSGKSNGEDGFEWGQSQKIPAKRFALRLTFRNGLL